MAPHEAYTYEGQELELFRHARHWKDYFSRQLRPYVRGDVLEVGAGLGTTTRVLCRGPVTSWTCLEPDPALARVLPENVRQASGLPVEPAVIIGTLADLPETPQFDTILYIDVLEHIRDDQAEAAAAARRLRAGGLLVVLGPAHPFLFTPFDGAIGHHRRYNRPMLRRLEVPGCRLTQAFYLDSCGLLASLGNRLVLSSSMPTRRQIAFWDRYLVRASTFMDRLTGYQVGKTVVAVWRQVDEGQVKE
jgi:SAM-dependent methyltransferase